MNLLQSLPRLGFLMELPKISYIACVSVLLNNWLQPLKRPSTNMLHLVV